MDNTSNNSQPNTANPQTAVPADGASNAADFQTTAPSDTLRNEVENLSVQETGEPLASSGVQAADTGWPIGWVITVGIMAAIALFVLVRLIKEAIEEEKTSTRSATVSAASRKSTPKKAAKKKPGAAQNKKKKPAKKRR